MEIGGAARVVPGGGPPLAAAMPKGRTPAMPLASMEHCVIYTVHKYAIATMMKLALHGVGSKTRASAGALLLQECNIIVASALG